MTRWALLLLLVFAEAACAGNLPPVTVRAHPAEALPHVRVHFSTGGDRVLSRDRSRIEENAAWLRGHPGAMLVLDGHCDERGGAAFNLRLGDRRARSVKAMLQQAGVGGERAIVVSSGEGRPIDPRHRPAAWRRNRRVEFSVP